MSPRFLFLICATTLLVSSCEDTGEPESMRPWAAIVSPSQDTTVTWPYAVNFEGSHSARIASHRWDFGDGYVEYRVNPGLYAWAAPGRYTVTYQVTDYDGLVSLPAQVVVTVEEPAGVAPEPGNWWGRSGFGSLDFKVHNQGGVIYDIGFEFEDWGCGGEPRNGRISAENPSGWPITNGEFTIETSFPARELAMTVHGTFDEHDAASGTWSAVSYGTTCSGDWNVTRSPPFIVVDVSADFNSTLMILGENCVSGRVVTLEVDDGADGTVDHTTSAKAMGIFAWFYDGEAPPFDVTEGALIRMYDAINEVTYAVLYVTVESVDAAADVVSGSAREGTRVTVGIAVPEPQAAPSPIGMTVDASGTWSADFSGLYDILPGTDVWVLAGCPLIAGDVPCYGITVIGWSGPEPPSQSELGSN